MAKCELCGCELDNLDENTGMCYFCQNTSHKWFEGRCDECGEEIEVAESFVTGLCYCKDCLDNAEANAIQDTMEE